MNWKYIWRSIGQNFPKFDENYKFTALRTSKPIKTISMETTIARHIRINLLKTNIKIKFYKQKNKEHITYRRTKMRMTADISSKEQQKKNIVE